MISEVVLVKRKTIKLKTCEECELMEVIKGIV